MRLPPLQIRAIRKPDKFCKMDGAAFQCATVHLDKFTLYNDGYIRQGIRIHDFFYE